MKRYLLLVAAAIILGMAAADAIWPAERPLLITGAPDPSEMARPSIWPTNASSEMCLPPPPPRPRGKYEYRPGERPTDLGIA